MIKILLVIFVFDKKFKSRFSGIRMFLMSDSSRHGWVMGPHQDNTKEMRKEQEGGDMSHPDYRETVQNI